MIECNNHIKERGIGDNRLFAHKYLVEQAWYQRGWRDALRHIQAKLVIDDDTSTDIRRWIKTELGES